MSKIEKSTLDYRQRFVFDEADVRGCIVRLEKTCRRQFSYVQAGRLS